MDTTENGNVIKTMSRRILIGRGVAIDTISFGGKKFLENESATDRGGFKIYYHRTVIKNKKIRSTLHASC